MPSYAFEGVRPVVDPSAAVHPMATLIGDVIVAAGCYVGPGASLRGDLGRIELRAGSNVQDCCTLHTFPGKSVVVEEGGHVGHAAILHGCTVGRGALIGMGALVMDGAVVGEDAFVAAMSLVKAGVEIPPRVLVAGIPATVRRELADEEIRWKNEGTRVYEHLARRALATLEEVQPLAAAEADRPTLPVSADAPRHPPKHEMR